MAPLKDYYSTKLETESQKKLVSVILNRNPSSIQLRSPPGRLCVTTQPPAYTLYFPPPNGTSYIGRL